MIKTAVAIIILTLLCFVIVCAIIDIYKFSTKYKNHVNNLKIGNRYRYQKRILQRSNPFDEHLSETLVEITEIKHNDNKDIYVQYKIIKPKRSNGVILNSSFKDFIDLYELE